MAKTTAKRTTRKTETPVLANGPKCDAKKLKAGHFLSRTSYMKVENTPRYGSGIDVSNESGLTWSIDHGVVSKECFSAHQYAEVVEMTRTELVQVYATAGSDLYTVNFDKVDGENRTLIGYTVNVENGFGRSIVIDLEDESKQKQVDHRTLHWLILRNVKYQVR